MFILPSRRLRKLEAINSKFSNVNINEMGLDSLAEGFDGMSSLECLDLSLKV